MPANQNSEQIARDKVDEMLNACGWLVQSKETINFNAGPGVAIREYQTDIGAADYVLFINKIPIHIRRDIHVAPLFVSLRSKKLRRRVGV